MKRIYIVGAGIMQVPVIQEAKRLGYQVIASDGNLNAEGFKFADVSLHIDTLDLEGNLNAVFESKIDGIITTSDLPVRTVAHICEILLVPGLSKNSALLSTNKYLLRKELSARGLITPQFRKFTMFDHKTIVELFKFPFIIKPVDSSASRGVSLVRNENELVNAFLEAKEYSKSGDIICEEYIEGREFSVESLTQNNNTTVIAITEKFTKGIDHKYFVEDRHIIPASVNEAEYLLIEQTAKEALKIIGLNNSASHTELKINNKGAVIIEIGARLGGDYITSDLVPLSTGVNMIKNIIQIAVGEPIEINRTLKRHAGVQFANSDNYKLVEKHLQNIKENPSTFRFNLEKYDSFRTLKNSLDRLGYYICTADSREALLKILDYK